MTKRAVIFFLVAVLLLVACQGDDNEPPAATQPAAEQLPATAPPVVEAQPTDSPVNLDPNQLRAQPWQWISFTGAAEAFELQSPQSYRITFNENDTVSVVADCNNAGGGYGADNGGRLTIEMGAITKAACPPGSRGEQFVNFLDSAVRYGFQGSNLGIELMADGGTMTLAPAQPIAVQPTLAPATATPLPPTATPGSVTNLPSPPGSVSDGGPRQHATGSYQAPYYTVASGDTVFGIAQRFGISVAQLLASNALDANGLIIPNQRLVIGAVPSAEGEATHLPSLPGTVQDQGPRQYAAGTFQAPYYTVAGGDTLYSIAARFGLSLPQLIAANALIDSQDIFPGQKLIISDTGDAVAYERVVFDNSIGATLNGVINQGQPKHYLLGAQTGQTMEINTNSVGVALGVSVEAPSGAILPLNGQNNLVDNVLYVTLPETGDYTVTVTPATLPEGPQMSFTISFVIQ